MIVIIIIIIIIVIGRDLRDRQGREGCGARLAACGPSPFFCFASAQAPFCLLHPRLLCVLTSSFLSSLLLLSFPSPLSDWFLFLSPAPRARLMPIFGTRNGKKRKCRAFSDIAPSGQPSATDEAGTSFYPGIRRMACSVLEGCLIDKSHQREELRVVANSRVLEKCHDRGR